MARLKFILLPILGLAACAPSPLYVQKGRVGTIGEVPRDGRGEPIWTAIPQAEPVPAMQTMPVTQGVPVTPPQSN